MKKVLQSDSRFVHITGCEIVSLYKKVPHQFGGWLIEVRYKDNDLNIFSETMHIEIDQNKFGKELINCKFKMGMGGDRLCYTNGMTDIDIYKQAENEYAIYYSINDGTYIYFFFTEVEFMKLKTWLTLEFKED